MDMTDNRPPCHLDQPPPPRLTTFVDIARWRAQHAADQVAFTFLTPGRGEPQSISYAELDQRSCAAATALLAQATPGQRVLIVQQPGIEYIVSLFACMYAGMVAVPVYPLDGFRLQHTLPRLQAITRDAQAAILLTSGGSLPAGGSGAGSGTAGPLGMLGDSAVLHTDQLDPALAGGYRTIQTTPGDLAILQYTSGTTGQPRGVALQHRHLLANAQQIYAAYHVPDAVCVFWLPPYHDMGLVGGLLLPMFAGRPSVLMSPTAFVQQPVAWLQAISQYRGTTTASPNFGFELCLRKVGDAVLESLDLSSLRVAIAGAEPIRAATMRRFAQRFAGCGFRGSALTPAYGMAEATLAITGKPLDSEPLAVDFEAAELHGPRGRAIPVAPADLAENGHAAQSQSGANAVSTIVGCGIPLDRTEVLIVDPESCRLLEDQRVGEIWVRGPSVAAQYWQQPESTLATFAATLASEQPTAPAAAAQSAPTYLRTGDLGFVHADQLFVSGRLKDLIIIAGRNYFAHELEAAIQAGHEALKAEGGVAFSLLPSDASDAGGERLVIVQEVLRPKRHQLSELVQQVRLTLAEQFELAPDAVLLVPAGSLSRTSSGKLQRGECRRRYQENELQLLHAWNRDSHERDAADSPPTLNSPQVTVEPATEHRREIARQLAPLWCEVLQLEQAAEDQHFLDCGGQSLAATGLLSRIRERWGVTVPWSTLFRAPHFGQLVTEIQRLVEAAGHAHRDAPSATHAAAPLAESNEGPADTAAPTELAAETRPLSSSQQRFWLLDQLGWQQAFLHVELTLQIRGSVDRGRLADLVRRLPERHAALRLRVETDAAGVPVQRIVAAAPLEVQRIDLCGLASEVRSQQLTRLRAEAAHQRFDLRRGPVARAVVVRISNDETALIFAAHHLVCDGSSLLLLMEDLAAQYRSDAAGREAASVSSPDAWQGQRCALAQVPSGAGLEYWADRLGDAPVESPLAVCRPLAVCQPLATHSPAVAAAAPSRLQKVGLSAELAGLLQSRSRQWQVTPFEILLAAWQSVLSRYGEVEERVFGVPVAGRDHTSLEKQVGCFINTLPIRIDSAAEETFAQCVERVSGLWRRDLEHGDVPLDQIIEHLALPRSADRLPLIQHLVLNQPSVSGPLSFGQARCEEVSSAYTTLGAYDTALICHEGELAIAYGPSRIDDPTATNLLHGLITLLGQALEAPERDVAKLEVCGVEERKRRNLASEPARVHQLNETVVEMFSRRAAMTPDQVAILDSEGSTTFAELEESSTQLAMELVAQGVTPGAIVALRLGRGRRIIESALAVWKAGAAYLPLDPSYPPQRTTEILADAQPVCLIEERGAANRNSEITISKTTTDASTTAGTSRGGAIGGEGMTSGSLPGASLGGLAYLIYTSGSTGKPKGVMIGHDNLANVLLAFASVPGLASGQRMLASTTMSFDISVLELFLPLVTGATSVIAPRSLSEDPDAVLRCLAAHRVDVIQATPSSLRMMLAGGWSPRASQTIWCGGEPLQLDLAESITATGAKLWNVYGPTETTVWSLAGEIASPVTSPLSLGQPIDSTTIRIVDAAGRDVPEGMAGELWLGGLGVGRGYWNQPELTAQRFVDCEKTGRMYRTGDRVRRRPEGRLEFLGRSDRQIKLRGHRVELGEIEAALSRCDGVVEAAVTCVVRSEVDRRLVAFYQPQAEAEVSQAALREALQAVLPPHMVPAALIPLAKIPHTPAGKIDYHQLPSDDAVLSALPAESAASKTTETTSPSTPTQEQLAAIWREVLGTETIGVEDNFFDSGGHSLMAAQVFSRLRTQLGISLPLREIYSHPTIAALARLVDAASERQPREDHREQAHASDSLAAFISASQATPARAIDKHVLSPAEQRLWFVDQLEPNHPFYNLPLAARLHGPLDHELLWQGLNDCVARHETLRSTYVVVDGKPARRIAERLTIEPQIVDLRTDEHAEATVRRMIAAQSRRPFDLATGPLVRMVSWRLSDQEHVVLLVMHHIISDGWSMGVMMRELTQFYHARRLGTPPRLRPLAVAYREYAAWQHEYLSAARVQPTIDYWKQTLQGAVQTLDLPIDFPRPPVQSFEGATLPLELSGDLSRQVDALARQLGVTPYSVLLASYGLLLSRLSRQRDLTIGTAVANRTEPLIEDLIGFFVNTVVVRQRCNGTETFAQWVRHVHQVASEAIDHQQVPFEQVVGQLADNRDRSHSPLFQAAFILQNTPMPLDALPELTLEPLEIDNGTAKYDLTLLLSQRDGAYRGHFEYRRSLLRSQSVQQFRDSLLTLLAAGVQASETVIDALPILSPPAQVPVLAHGIGPVIATDHAQTLHDRIGEAMRRYPAAMAIRHNGRFITYAELNQYVLAIASGLQRAGLGRGDRVLVYLPRSIDQIAATLAVMRCGAAFSPVDTQMPPGRLQAISAELKPAAVITDPERIGSVRESVEPSVICGSAADLAAAGSGPWQEVDVSPSDLAYLIFTSGSTGVPKGVAIQHAAICNFIEGFARTVAIQPGMRSGHLFSPSFDGAIAEVFPVLASGGCVEVIDQEIAVEPAALADQLTERRVEFISLTPATLSMLDPQRLSGVKKILSAGAALPGELAARWMKSHRLFNAYGPTECAVGVTVQRLDDTDLPSPSIGRPLPNTRLYVLDANRQLVPDGVVGELYIGGAGVGRGYWDQPEQTSQCFMPDPFVQSADQDGQNARMYRTGDLGRWNRAGRLEIVGRADDQIKLRGFRIEPGEISALLDQVPGVRQSAVVALGTDTAPSDAETCPDRGQSGERRGKRLVAYVVADTASETSEAGETRVNQARQERDHVESWRTLFDQSQAAAVLGVDPADDFAGWTSVITGRPIPLEPMRRWADAAAGRIGQLQPRRLLEIGCGTGLMLLRIGEQLEHYTGIDLLDSAIDRLRQTVDRRPSLRERVVLMRRAADELEELPGGGFDTIVLNSVVQYFPSDEYLLRVLRGAERLLTRGGKIFLGDLRNLRLQGALAIAAELQRRGDMPLTVGQFRRRVRSRIDHDEELLVDLDLMAVLTPHLSRLAAVRTQVKTADGDNELNRFRFDAVLYFDDVPGELGAMQDGSDAESTLAVCNANVHREAMIQRAVRAADDRVALDDVLRACETAMMPHIGPSEIASAAAAAGLEINVDWHPDRIDAVLVSGHRGGQRLSATELGRLLSLTALDSSAVDSPDSKPPAWTSTPLVHRRSLQLIQRMRSELQQRLPAYMIPASFVLIDELPLTIQGKLDRAALPPPPSERLNLAGPPRPAQTQSQRILVEIWEELLDVAPIGIEDDFFELGGHSMLAVRMVAQVQQRSRQTLPLSALFGKPTIEHLAALLDKPGAAESDTLVPLSLSGPGQPLFCIHPAGGTVFCYHALANHFSGKRPVYGVQARGLDGREPPHRTLVEMARDYAAAIRSVAHRGPVNLVGWSLGGNIAYEVARQLRASGREVAMLAMLDSGLIASQEDWNEQEFLSLIAALFPGQQHASLEELRQQPSEQQLQYFVSQAALAGIVPADASQVGPHIFDVFRANIQAVHDHQPQPYGGRVLLIRPADQARTTALFDDQALGWGALVANIDVMRVPGDHAHMLQQPAVAEIAKQLGSWLASHATRFPARAILRPGRSKANARNAGLPH